MVTEVDLKRRLGSAWLLGTLLPRPIRAGYPDHEPVTTRWATAWSDGNGHWIGVLRHDPTGWYVTDRLAVPTRAHGLLELPDGSLVAMARRPGDWMVRWQPVRPRRKATPPTWAWAAAQRQFNGHALLLPDHRHLLVTETDTAADGLGTGRVTVRPLDAPGKVIADWPTQGRDPHQLLLSPDKHHVWVANGGLAMRPETGRVKQDGSPMDASVVALDSRTGTLQRHWTLADERLSLRHLAWHAPSATLGVAMQAEHADLAIRQAAPVLAVVRPDEADAQLRSLDTPQSMAGYGGDICATAEGFAVSSPRAGHVGRWEAQGQWLGTITLAQACALAADDATATVTAAGSKQAMGWRHTGRPMAVQTPDSLPLPIAPDNHWLKMNNSYT